MRIDLRVADAIEFLRSQPADSLDLVFFSPPYEDCRTYGIDFALKGQAWVDWMVQVYTAAQAACKGLVAGVVEGKTKSFQWTATPALLMADMHRAGLRLRKPPAFHRVGIAGSGGPDWLRNDYEFIVCTSKGKLPWSDNTAMGLPPKWAPGGEISNRLTDGTRVNARSKHKRAARGYTDGDTARSVGYKPPVLANPGNVIHCKVGGGVMGNRLCHENEAPFPECLAEFFIRSFCPPGGMVCDPFSGSGTTATMADRHGRNFTGCDIRASQVAIAEQRIAEERQALVGKESA